MAAILRCRRIIYSFWAKHLCGAISFRAGRLVNNCRRLSSRMEGNRRSPGGIGCSIVDDLLGAIPTFFARIALLRARDVIHLLIGRLLSTNAIPRSSDRVRYCFCPALSHTSNRDYSDCCSWSSHPDRSWFFRSKAILLASAAGNPGTNNALVSFSAHRLRRERGPGGIGSRFLRSA